LHKNNPLKAGYFFSASIRGDSAAIQFVRTGFLAMRGSFCGSKQWHVTLAAVFTT